MTTQSLAGILLLCCFAVAVGMAIARGEYKSSGAWFFTGYALAAILIVLVH